MTHYGVGHTNFWSSFIVADAIITELLAKKHYSSSVDLAIALNVIYKKYIYIYFFYKDQKLIYQHLLTGCFMKISLQSSELNIYL